MGCCAGCPASKREPFEPCSECGPYGTICCLKMTAGDDTWYLRSYPNVGGDIPEYYWQPGDDCDSGLNGYAFDSINLCGQLRSSGPCGNQLPRQWAGWQVLDDCSGIVLRLHYDTGHGIAKFAETVATDWITLGLPITFTTPDTWTGSGDYDGGDVTIEACAEGEPPPPEYLICCMQLSAAGRWGVNIKQDRPASAVELCLDDESELRISRTGTEQCSSGYYYLFDDETGADVIASGADPEPFSLGLGSYAYSISDDYSTITLTVDYNFNHYSTGFPATWQEVYLGTYTVDIPFTAEWFMSPVVIDIEGVDVANDDEPVFATLTLGPCGHIDDAETCMPECMIHRYSIGGVDYLNYKPLYMAVDSFQDPQPCCNDPDYEEVPLFYFWNGTGDPEDPIINPGDAYEGYYIEMFQVGSCAGLRVWIWCEVGSTQLQIKVIAHHPGSFTVPSFTTTLTENITLECDEDGEVSNEGSEVSINKPWCNETGHSEAQHYIRILIYSQNAGLP